MQRSASSSEPSSRVAKLGEAPRLKEVTAELRSIVLASPPHTRLGRESELCLRLRCHQGLLRQVARRLEAQGLLYSRRGPSGGYFALRPTEDLVIDGAALYLVAVGITLRDALLATRGLVIDAAGIAAGRSMQPEAEALRSVYNDLCEAIPEDTDSTTFVAQEERIDRAIFDMVGNAPLKLFVNMLNRFSLQDFGDTMFARQPTRRRVYRQERLNTLHAILRGDALEARKSMEVVIAMIDDWIPEDDLDRRIGLDMVLPGDDDPVD